MKIDPRQLEWIHKPQLYFSLADKIVMETEPNTNITAAEPHARAAEFSLVAEGSFCFTMRVDFAFREQFDQCGIVIYRGDDRQAVCSAARRSEDESWLQAIVYHTSGGDRSAREIHSGIRWMYFRIWHRSGMIHMQYSFNGNVFRDMREFKTENDGRPVRLGIYACSPGNSCFDCTFSQMTLEQEAKNGY